MHILLRRAGVAALALTLTAAGARAQSAADHAAHHPGASAVPDTSTKPAASGQPAIASGMPGGMGMGAGMGMSMGTGNGAGGAQPMMQMMSMMQMMQRMMAHNARGVGAGMMRFDHIAGRIAFLKAELAITPAQEKTWDGFANAMRTAAGRMHAMRGGIAGAGAAGTLPARLRGQAAELEARLAALSSLTAPADALYRALTPAQRRKADALMAGPRGMM